jgi:cobalt/nickel transport system ATP-binding protein
MNQKGFQLTNVGYQYPGGVPALQQINLEIPDRTRIAVVGENGSGKSTLMKLLDALYFPQSGTLTFQGVPLTQKKMEEDGYAYEFRKKVAFLFQDPESQLFSASVWEEVCYAPLQLKWEPDRIRASAESILRQFGIEHLQDRPPFRLSIGEKKKVALASVLILDPEVLLLDEPVAALDPRTQSLLLELIHTWSGNGKTIITSTHDLSILKEISDLVYVLQKGRIVHSSPPAELLENQELLEECNLIHAHTHKHLDIEHVHPHTHDFHSHTHDEE